MESLPTLATTGPCFESRLHPATAARAKPARKRAENLVFIFARVLRADGNGRVTTTTTAVAPRIIHLPRTSGVPARASGWLPRGRPPARPAGPRPAPFRV